MIRRKNEEIAYTTAEEGHGRSLVQTSTRNPSVHGKREYLFLGTLDLPVGVCSDVTFQRICADQFLLARVKAEPKRLECSNKEGSPTKSGGLL